MKILFERHYFHNATNGRFDKSNPDLSNARRGGYGKYSQQHPKFEMAKALDENAAYHSTSFSGFQIMGANYSSAGEYKSAKEFGESMLKGSEDVHLDAFVNYVNNNSSLKNSLQKRDWKKFAEGYNGPSYKDNNYDTKMSDNYENLRDDPYKGYDGESRQSGSSEKKASNIPVSFDSSIEGYQK